MAVATGPRDRQRARSSLGLARLQAWTLRGARSGSGWSCQTLSVSSVLGESTSDRTVSDPLPLANASNPPWSGASIDSRERTGLPSVGSGEDCVEPRAHVSDHPSCPLPIKPLAEEIVVAHLYGPRGEAARVACGLGRLEAGGHHQVVQSSDVVRARRHGADGGERRLQELLDRLLSVEAENRVGNLGIAEQSGEHDLV